MRGARRHGTLRRPVSCVFLSPGSTARFLGTPFAGTPSPAARSRQPANNDRFAGRVVLITGATSGIGEATARAFAAGGARVFFCGRRQALGEQVAASIRAAGGEARFMQADVREEREVAAFVQQCVNTYGGLDIAFNNAGIEGPEGRLPEIPVMRSRERGVVINTVSVLGSGGSADWGAYSAAKHAVLGLTRAAALANARHGIRVLSISPGSTDTELLRRMYDDDLPESADGNPTGRVAQPAEIAAAVLNLAAPEMSFLTGADVQVDGASSA
ncbi:SDR family oxidoreductase [soil metagenome]